MSLTACIQTMTPELKQPTRYNMENDAVNCVSCSFLISGYYERTPKYIYYFLLVFTVVIRNQKWLAAGAAASVLIYLGVAATHMIALFATNNRLKLQNGESHCKSLHNLGVNPPFVACTGVYGPDFGSSMTIVSSVMLCALTIVAWSTTFKNSTSQAYSDILASIDGHRSNILSSDWIQPRFELPAMPLGSHWNYPLQFSHLFWNSLGASSFSKLISMAHGPSQNLSNGSSSACIYSYFATAGSSGRKIEDITVWECLRSTSYDKWPGR